LPNTIGDIIKPKLINELASENVKQLACNKYHSMALTKDGIIYSWGS
jgi:alpha-tubulin suppressor-like RCC1 family protein